METELFPADVPYMNRVQINIVGNSKVISVEMTSRLLCHDHGSHEMTEKFSTDLNPSPENATQWLSDAIYTLAERFDVCSCH